MNNNIMVNVYNRNSVESNFSTDNSKTIWISITDKQSDFVQTTSGNDMKAKLFVRFNDVEKGENGCISANDAKVIREFVQNNLEGTERIIVNCDGGVSRSAGVAAAILLMIGQSDNQIFKNPRFVPNMTVYRTLLNEIFGSQYTFENDKEIKNKELYNLEIWKKAQDL